MLVETEVVNLMKMDTEASQSSTGHCFAESDEIYWVGTLECSTTYLSLSPEEVSNREGKRKK
jgi:hypothetical protein